MEVAQSKYRNESQELRGYYTLNDTLEKYCKDRLIDENITFFIDLSELNERIHFCYGNELNKYRKFRHTIKQDYDLSCGQRMLVGFVNNTYYEEIKKLFKEEYRETILFDIYKMIIDFLKDKMKFQFLIASDNNDDTRSILHNVFDKLARWQTPWEINPNSKNLIKIYIV